MDQEEDEIEYQWMEEKDDVYQEEEEKEEDEEREREKGERRRGRVSEIYGGNLMKFE